MNRLPPFLQPARAIAIGMLVMTNIVFAGGAGAQDVMRPPGLVPRPPANVPQGGFNLFGGWTLFNPQKPVEQAPAPKRPPPEPDGVVYESADAAIQARKQPPEKIVLVVGDSLAEQLGQGLADLYVRDRAGPAIVGRTAEEFGVLPPEERDAPDLMASLPSALAAARSNATVLAVGGRDLRPLKDGDQMVEPLSERWNEIYGQRLEDMITLLRQRGAVLVVGLAPVQAQATSEQYEKLNDLLRLHATRTGATFVPVWDGFVDDEGKFAVFGAAVDGQRRRLRANDGVKFTKAGARKLAFFSQKDLARLLAEQKPDEPGLVAAPGGPQPAVSLSDRMRASSILAGGGPTPALLPASALAGEPGRILREGAPLPSVPGRADDHSWPAGAARAP